MHSGVCVEGTYVRRVSEQCCEWAVSQRGGAALDPNVVLSVLLNQGSGVVFEP